MLEFFRDSMWGFWGVVITVLIFIIGYLIQRTRKSLLFEVSGKSSLLSAHTLKNDIEIFYRKIKVENLKFLTIRFTNNGNVSINSNDYERDLLIKPEGKFNILNYEVSQIHPENLKVQLDMNDDGILIKPILLNKNDYFEVSFIYSGDIKFIKADARISGISKIHSKKSAVKLNFFVSAIPVFLFLTVMLVKWRIYGVDGVEMIFIVMLSLLSLMSIANIVVDYYTVNKSNEIIEI